MSVSETPATELLREIEARVGSLPERHRRAFLAVDRARHVRDVDRAHAWRDMPLPLDTPHGPMLPSVDALIARHGSYAGALFSSAFKDIASTISAPGIYAVCYQLLGLDEGHRLLELGTGTGYGAALAAEIVGASGSVTSIEVDPVLVQAARERVSAPNVRVLHDDGLARADLVAASDRICVTFAVEQLPQQLLSALQEGAVLIAPVVPPPARLAAGQGGLGRSDLGFTPGQRAVAGRRTAHDALSTSVGPSGCREHAAGDVHRRPPVCPTTPTPMTSGMASASVWVPALYAQGSHYGKRFSS